MITTLSSGRFLQEILPSTTNGFALPWDDLNRISSASLSLDGQIDKEILANDIKQQLFYRIDFGDWRLRPGFYNNIVADAIYQLAAHKFAPAAGRLRSVTARERQIPSLLAQAKLNLDKPRVAAIVARFAAQDVDGTTEFLRTDLPKAFSDVHDAVLVAQFHTANNGAIKALRDYASFIRQQVVPIAHGGYALGRDHYQYLASLENAHDVPIAQLLAAGEAALRGDTANFGAAAHQIDPTRPPIAVYKRVSHHHPSAQQLIPTAQQQLRGLIAFIKAHHIIDLPNAPIAAVVPTPEFAASTTEAAFDSPGPLERVATAVYYDVTVPKTSALGSSTTISLRSILTRF